MNLNPGGDPGGPVVSLIAGILMIILGVSSITSDKTWMPICAIGRQKEILGLIISQIVKIIQIHGSELSM
jgi:hypothetical protein